MIDKTREEFEAWFRATQGYDATRGIALGGYCFADEQRAYEAWQSQQARIDGQWIPVDEATPKQGDRALLAIRGENCPVVGYWGEGEYEACTVNVKAESWGGEWAYVESDFDDVVTHWMTLPEVPTNDQ